MHDKDPVEVVFMTDILVLAIEQHRKYRCPQCGCCEGVVELAQLFAPKYQLRFCAHCNLPFLVRLGEMNIRDKIVVHEKRLADQDIAAMRKKPA